MKTKDLPEESGPAGGWGSLRGLARIYGAADSEIAALDTLRRQNKPHGFMCMSCAWPKPANYHAFEFCENGAKMTLWELTTHRCRPEFFEGHTVEELRGWKDHDLEAEGRLTAPMRYDAATDRYVETGWEEAFAEIGATLRRLDHESVVFYASGHAGLEASYLYALLARLYGCNNLPQSSNMCHETTSVGLKRVIGSPVGTIVWEDLEQTDLLMFFGQNPGTCSPRFLHPMKAVKDRGGHIISFNPMREQGLVSFIDPQDMTAMLTGKETVISDQYHQVRAGGDVAALAGLCKAVLEADDAARRDGGARVLDTAFIEEHTTGFEDFAAAMRATGWAEIERESALTEEALRAAAAMYLSTDKVIAAYGMGLTQQAGGWLNIAMLTNLMLLRGNVGRPGAGITPVRGHSNVQGQRTVGIAEKTKLVPMDKLRELFGFEPPEKDGTHIVDAVKGLAEGSVRATISLGGNLVRAVPDRNLMEACWPRQELTVMVSTKLNRSHLFPGKVAYILPCLSRAEEDVQEGGPQAVSIEESFAMIHGSTGHREPASDRLMSELAIVAGIAKATLEPNPKVKWDDWTADYGKVRDLIEETYPDDFKGFNERLFEPGGFHRDIGAHRREWRTESGKAVFTTPERLNSLDFDDAPGRYRLVTVRSNDQFNTTIYGYSDRFRGIEGTRDVILMSEADIAEAGLHRDQRVTLVCDFDDGEDRRLGGLAVIPYDLPRGTIVSYFPECNVLIPLSHHDELSKTPASKAVPVRIEAEGVAAREP
ncbi:FdhF/YdeP family oxidoreductase [Amaricoccus solimangrovi]|uniref:FdhF/YdeP family oxidoreductase n=1 Tax=Amaricoccus solimangrovi TaxID=2589815 RepID=A0A501WPE7_9RHOB|nr:FdhF/YdeP family oxidoreductase [Amaricoccus solimangrovi]TPE51633.1 FdhF/YdeP family oxidoreductase [Amaricoccus solimangrovi]